MPPPENASPHQGVPAHRCSRLIARASPSAARRSATISAIGKPWRRPSSFAAVRPVRRSNLGKRVDASTGRPEEARALRRRGDVARTRRDGRAANLSCSLPGMSSWMSDDEERLAGTPCGATALHLSGHASSGRHKAQRGHTMSTRVSMSGFGACPSPRPSTPAAPARRPAAACRSTGSRATRTRSRRSSPASSAWSRPCAPTPPPSRGQRGLEVEPRARQVARAHCDHDEAGGGICCGFGPHRLGGGLAQRPEVGRHRIGAAVHALIDDLALLQQHDVVLAAAARRPGRAGWRPMPAVRRADAGRAGRRGAKSSSADFHITVERRAEDERLGGMANGPSGSATGRAPPRRALRHGDRRVQVADGRARVAPVQAPSSQPALRRIRRTRDGVGACARPGLPGCRTASRACGDRDARRAGRPA